MPLYPMPRNLSNSQKASFLRKRISDTETLAAKEVTFVEKNYPLFEKKVTLLNQMRRERANSIAMLSIISERERTLSRQVRNFRERLKTLERVSQWVETDKRAISNLRKSNNQQATNAELAALASELGLAKKTQTKPKQKSKPVRNSSDTPQSLSYEKFKVYKAKADAFDRKNRKSQSEVKQALQPELKKFGRCAYCETKLLFADCHIDHIQPVSKGGLSTESNCVLICAKCNRSKGAMLLRPFCKKASLDYDKVVTRLEVLGKDC